jgi:head-tail adaptor
VKDQKAIFERFTEPGDQWSGEAGGWQETFREFISLRPLTGREVVETQQIIGQVTHRAFLHWSETASGLHPKDRFRIEEPTPRTFDIVSVINIQERNREIELVCKEHL